MRTDPTLVITGGIGSGKSYVAQLFTGHGWAYIDADAIGHDVLKQGEVVAEVARLWPQTVNGTDIDRRVLANAVFSDPEALIRLEAITHPRMKAAIDEWLADTSGPRIIEVSVLKAIDPAWGMKLVVDASVSIRLERLMGRGLSRDEALQRMGAQPSRAKWLEAADLVIDNSRQKELALNPLIERLIR
jgi:dephospho-CoA kinase